MRALVATCMLGCGGSSAASDGATGDGLGDSGSSCPPAVWCVETAPVPATLLHDVWAIDPGDVFAVGNAGTIVRRRANTWSTMPSGTTHNLRGVWASSATDVWAVGESGTLLHYDGQTWSARDPGVTIDLHAVWGTGERDVWIAGPSMVLHFDGARFTSHPLVGELYAIAGTGPSDVWVTGENSFVAHYQGAWTTGIDPGAGTTYLALTARAVDDVWVTTFVPGKETLHFDGTGWIPHSAPATVFQGIHATPRALWAAGGSKVGRFDGATWALDSPAGGSAQLWGLHGSGAYLWAVGSDSLILHRDDT